MSNAHAEMSAERSDFAKRLEATIGRRANEVGSTAESVAQQALTDDRLMAELRFRSTRGRDAERISPQDTTGMIARVAAGKTAD